MTDPQSQRGEGGLPPDANEEPTMAVAVLDVRLQHVRATNHRPQLPLEIQIHVQLDPPTYQLIEDGVRFRVAHHVQFIGGEAQAPTEYEPDPTNVVGEVHLTHIIDIDVQLHTGQPLGHEGVKAKLISFAANAVFPYLRADLQHAAVSVGLPPIAVDAPPTPYGVHGQVTERESGSEPAARTTSIDPDVAVASQWGPLRTSINELVMEAARLHGRVLPESGSTLAIDDELVSHLELSASVWKGVKTAIAQLEASAQLACDGIPIEEGPCFALFRASIEVGAMMHWLLSPDVQSRRIERYLTWRVLDLNDCANARRNMNIHEDFPKEELESILSIATALPDVNATKVKNGKIGSKLMISEVDPIISTNSWPVLYTWQLASAHAHGRPWADTRFGVLPLDGASETVTPLTSIAARTYGFAQTAHRLCAAVLRLFTERATVGSNGSGQSDSDGPFRVS